MSAREAILTRIRAAQGRQGAEPDATQLERVRATIARHEAGPLPGNARNADPVAKFRAECDRVGTTHAEVGSIDAVPAEVARYLRANNLEARVAAWHEFAELDWTAAGVAVDDRPANPNDRTGLTGCFCTIAETGTLLLLSSPATPKVTALLPETHLCVASKSRLVNTMEDSFALLRRERGEPPRATFFVSGPSRTADIEQTIVIGAHGPYRVHVILIP
ncbi:Lactate utilization protein C [Usitatibacter palustris]|uniref:Lactate utilization protein C n=1 Tax=Usitatibacter palustris TaxID=2732487 RepID=A0A6M4HAN8_9PROT|nr:Lactate utilization protein C [Usitatibacter palustris]